MPAVSSDFLTALRDATVFAPELPEAAAADVFEQVVVGERSLLLPAKHPNRNPLIVDYVTGTALEPDEITVLGMQYNAGLASADHATKPVREKNPEHGADHGTAGIVHLLAARDHTTAIIPVGRQTGNANVDVDHPLKNAMSLLLPSRAGFLSVHGMEPGKLTAVSDRTEIHGVIGLGGNEELGTEPNEQSWLIAEQLQAFAAELGLRVIVGNTTRYNVIDEVTGNIVVDEETNQPKIGPRLAARDEGSTTNHAYKIMQGTGIEVPAFQIELTRLLRLIPSDFENGWHANKKSRIMGVYMGYLLAQRATLLIRTSGR